MRGVPSSGMLCSAWDLGWVPEPDGVLVELPLDLMPGDLCPAEPPADVSPCAAAEVLDCCMSGFWPPAGLRSACWLPASLRCHHSDLRSLAA